MPLVNNPDLPRHAGDLAKVKRKIAEYEAGHHQHAESGVPEELAVRMRENTTAGLYRKLRELENAYVQAMLEAGMAAEIIESVTQRKPT